MVVALNNATDVCPLDKPVQCLWIRSQKGLLVSGWSSSVLHWKQAQCDASSDKGHAGRCAHSQPSHLCFASSCTSTKMNLSLSSFRLASSANSRRRCGVPTARHTGCTARKSCCSATLKCLAKSLPMRQACKEQPEILRGPTSDAHQHRPGAQGSGGRGWCPPY